MNLLCLLSLLSDYDPESSSDGDDIEDEDSRMAKLDEELRSPQCTSKPRIKELLQITKDYRKECCLGMEPDTILQTYRHLHIPEMVRNERTWLLEL